ncbi:Succinylornithine transaminase/acetylornithine aminotransferase [Rubripirellula tenax]|uniref:Succinylornithine transaminase/acetylornithine aminotransferase n=1 Tax=Rubripirellula tenax TaxID=2528015 RepID=A0A5C6F4R8_9BACT|nr:aminotransferase class III-fold pyridoxal phosphate-dependent enzyme [Rubripirellula tenax]TWU54451.1 Succinylornithine transaminase/acetylornithine aminotransferase [Rubripirellula tenax]
MSDTNDDESLAPIDGAEFPQLEDAVMGPANEPEPEIETGAEPDASVARPSPRKRFTGRAIGIRRGDANGYEIVDALAGRASVFGFGFDSTADAIRSVADQYLGDASAWQDRGNHSPSSLSLRDAFGEFLKPFGGVQTDSVSLASSSDAAIEQMLANVRHRHGGKRYRTIAMVGSDHGRTGMCRTASGRPELHDGFGPMMAGFAHAPTGDLAAIESMIDDNTGCILLCPIDFAAGAVACETGYLKGLRRLCDQHDLLLAVDETQLMFGASGSPLTWTSITDVPADMFAVAGGLFAGMSGGLVFANERSTSRRPAHSIDNPLLAAVAVQTIESMFEHDLLEPSADHARTFAIELAESISSFEFVRDIHATGMTIGVETDIESTDVVAAATKQGLRIESAGDVGIRIQLPLALTPDDRTQFLSRFASTLGELEQSTANMNA